jgi:hypothetical protein
MTFVQRFEAKINLTKTHGVHARRSWTAPARPVAREIEFGSGIAGDKLSHLPATPSGWAGSIATIPTLGRVNAATCITVRNGPMLMMSPSLRRLCKQEHSRKSGRQGRQLHAITPTHYAAWLIHLPNKSPTTNRNGGAKQNGCCLKKERHTPPIYQECGSWAAAYLHSNYQPVLTLCPIVAAFTRVTVIWL